MEARGRTTTDTIGERDHWSVPALLARRDGVASRFARRLAGRHPAAVFFAALLAGFIALAALSVALGLVVTEVLVSTAGIGSADERAIRSLVADRSGFEADASAVGSTIGGAPLLPILVGVIAVVCAVTRHWRIAAFAVFALVVESATYRVTSIAVPRERPNVARLEDLPADASYPSGHTAAAIAVYAGLVLLLTSRFRNRTFRLLAWLFAIAVPAFVAFSRMMRGMHHPLDIAGGMAVGVGAVLVLLFACRAAGAAAEAVAPRRVRSRGASRIPAAG